MTYSSLLVGESGNQGKISTEPELNGTQKTEQELPLLQGQYVNKLFPILPGQQGGNIEITA